MHPVWIWILTGWFAGFHHLPWLMPLLALWRWWLHGREPVRRPWVVVCGACALLAGFGSGRLSDGASPSGARVTVTGHRPAEDRLLHRVRPDGGGQRFLRLPQIHAAGSTLWVPHGARLPVIELSGTHLRQAQVPPAPTLVGSLTLGHPAPPRLKAELRSAGLSHVLAISGLHLSLVTLVVVAGLGRLHRVLPARWGLERRALEVVVCLAFVWWYRWITGSSVSTTRAAIMMSNWLLFSRYLGAGGLGTSLFWSAACIWIWDPACWRDPGFQLSFAAVGGIALASRGVPRGAVATAVAASVGASIATLPIVWFHFARVSPMFLFNNLLLVPIFSFIIIPSAFIIILLVQVWPTGGLFLQATADGLWLSLAGPLGAWNRLWPEWTPVGAALWTLVLGGAALWIVRGGLRRRLLLAAPVLLAFWLLPWGRQEASRLRLTFFSLRGESVLVRAPGGRTLLVDAGAAGLAGECARRGVTRLDRVVITHNHADHVQELFRLVGEVELGTVWVGPRFPQAWRARLRRLGAAVEPMPACAWVGPVRLRLRSPHDGTGPAPPPYWSENDTSLVLELAWRGHRIWFFGDIEAPAERELMERVPSPGRVTLVKVAHHGRITSSTEPLWEWIRPQIAVICGDEASSVVLDRLRRTGAALRTVVGRPLEMDLGPRFGEMEERTCED